MTVEEIKEILKVGKFCDDCFAEEAIQTLLSALDEARGEIERLKLDSGAFLVTLLNYYPQDQGAPYIEDFLKCIGDKE